MRKARAVEEKVTPEELAAVLKRLPADSPMRRIAHSLVTGRPVASIQPLIGAIMRLPAKRWREREILVRALGQSASRVEDRDVAATVLSSIVENNPREKLVSRLLRGAGWAGFMFVAVMALGPLVNPLYRASVHLHSPTYYGIHIEPLLAGLLSIALDSFVYVWVRLAAFWPKVLVLPAVSLMWDVVRYRRANRVRAAAARELGRLGMGESVGALARAVTDKNPGVRRAAVKALRKMLPAIDSQYCRQLDSEAIADLERVLQYQEKRDDADPELTRLIQIVLLSHNRQSELLNRDISSAAPTEGTVPVAAYS